MTTPLFSEAEVLKALGGEPNDVASELADFAKSASVLSSDQPRLIDLYPREWVAVHGGKVIAHASDLGKVLRDLEILRVAPGHAIIRFIDRDEHALIL